MEHIEAVKKVQEIEKKYPVCDIKYKNVCVWPYLRIYLVDSQSSTKRELKANKKTITTVLESLLYYGVSGLFKKYTFWTFTNVERRKLLRDKLVHRVCGAIGEIANDKTLFFEKPVPNYKPARKNEIIEKNIVGESLLLLLTNMLQKVIRSSFKKTTGTDVLDSILADYDFSFDYKERINHFVAQYTAMKILLRAVHKPYAVFLESPFSLMGYVLAFKETGIKTIELQHGVINSNHLGYNFPYKSKELFPDAICVYGDSEEFYLKHVQPNYCKEIFNTGYYYIDKANDVFSDDPFKDFRTLFNSIIVVSGQMPETDMFEFTKIAAQNNPESLFIYIPRFGLESDVELPNLVIKNNTNIYQNIKWCDVHVTMFSTTCIEAQYFNRPTIFYNINQLSAIYYGDILSEKNGCFFVNNIDEFSEAMNKVLVGKFEYKHLFTENAIDNFKNLIEELISRKI